MPAARYAVRKLAWTRRDDADDPLHYLLPQAATPEVSDLATHEEAATACRELEAAARAKANPFRYGGPGLFYQSSLDAPRFHDWLLDAGIDPPKPGKKGAEPNYAKWWKGLAPGQRETVWEALDKVRFFEVAEEHPKRTAYVVVEVTWTWNDESWLDADPEGGVPRKAFRDRAKAEAYCAERNREKRATGEMGFEYFNFGERVGHRGAGETVYHAAEADFYEVIEVEVEG